MDARKNASCSTRNGSLFGMYVLMTSPSTAPEKCDAGSHVVLTCLFLNQ